MTATMDPAAVESDLEDFDRLKDLILTVSCAARASRRSRRSRRPSEGGVNV